MSPAVVDPDPLKSRETHDAGPSGNDTSSSLSLVPSHYPTKSATTAEQPGRDAAAFSTWYSTECPRVFGYLLRRTGDATIAEDLAAEVFAIAWKVADAGVPRPGWAFITARNLLANQRRSDARFAEVHRELSNQIRTGAIPGFAFPPGQEDPKIRPFIEAMDLLNAEQRELIMVRYWDELSVAECARLFFCSVGAMKVRLHRARAALASLYREQSALAKEAS